MIKNSKGKKIMSIKKNEINILDGIPNSNNIFAISGRDLGYKQRKSLRIDQLEEKFDNIEIYVPDNIVILSSSFFLGFLGESVRKCGSREKFKEKFIFKTNGRLDNNIEDGITDALNDTNPLEANQER